MNRDEFIRRVIVLTNEKNSLNEEYQDLINISYSCSFPVEIQKDLENRLVKTRQAIKHVESNIKLNRDMADRL